MNECVIYDFETLGQDQQRSAVLSFAMLSFSEQRYLIKPYTFEELLDECKLIKFDVRDQVENYQRVIDKDTVKWWSTQGEYAKRQLKPSDEDRSIAELHSFITSNVDCRNVKKSYSRGNTFDTMFLQYIMQQIGKPEPFHWGNVRDTRSMIDGMLVPLTFTGTASIDNAFVPRELESKIVKHDPRHDIALDVMRMQTAARIITGVE